MEEQEIKVQEQEITLASLLFIVKKNILLIFIITFTAALIGGIYGFFIKDITYSATTTAIVEAEVSNSNEQSSAYSYSLSLTNTFKEFIVTDPVLSKAIDKLKGDYPGITKKELKESVSVVLKASTLIITVSAKTSDPDKSIAVANAIINSAIECANQLDDITGEVKYIILANKLKVIEDANETIATRGALTICAVSVLLGLIVSFGLVLVIHLTDNTFKSKKAFEQAFGINIIACLQDSEMEGANR